MNSLTPVTGTIASWRALPREVWVLVAAQGVNRLGAFTLPFLTLTVVESFGASLVQAGYLLTAFGLATIPSRLLGGLLADRLGARSTIVAGLVLTALAQLLLAGAPSLAVAASSVVVLGLAFEIHEPAGQSLVADATTPAGRPAAFGLSAAAMAAAGMAAGLLAALVAGVDLRWLFVVDAVTCLACAGLVARALPSRRTPRTGTTSPGRAWRDVRLIVMLATGTVFAVVYLQLTIALPLTLAARHQPASSLGLLLSLAAATTVLGQPLLARTRTRDDFTVMAMGYLLLAVGLFCLGAVDSLAGFVAATVVWSLGDLVLLGRAYSVVAGLAPEGGRGAHFATYGLSWGVAGWSHRCSVRSCSSGAGLRSRGRSCRQ